VSQINHCYCFGCFNWCRQPTLNQDETKPNKTNLVSIWLLACQESLRFHLHMDYVDMCIFAGNYKW